MISRIMKWGALKNFCLVFYACRIISNDIQCVAPIFASDFIRKIQFFEYNWYFWMLAGRVDVVLSNTLYENDFYPNKIWSTFSIILFPYFFILLQDFLENRKM